MDLVRSLEVARKLLMNYPRHNILIREVVQKAWLNTSVDLLGMTLTKTSNLLLLLLMRSKVNLWELSTSY